jgi:SsrA-binding protein
MGIKVIADNRKARFHYEILEKLEVGLVLQGSEVKALREGKANLGDGFARFNATGGELCSVHISPYKNGGYSNHEPLRPRKLLLHKLEHRRWLGKIKERGLTVVPLKLYFNDGGRVKCELALAKGKKVHDKRDALKKKAIDREAKAAIKNRRMG